MEERFPLRLQELLEGAVCGPKVMAGIRDHLVEFLKPYIAGYDVTAQKTHVHEYVQGLISKIARKTGEAIAYFHDRGRQGLQKFIGLASWDHALLLRTLAKQVGERIGQADGVIVFDPSAFAKKGQKSVGVARQWSGRLGKVENCQVGVFMGYVSRREHALVGVRLYLPREWTDDRARCIEAGVPTGTKFRTRHELALEMLDELGNSLPHSWVTGDDEMGRPAHFRAILRERGERYLLAVPSNTLVRDLEVEPPSHSGRGRPPARPYVPVTDWRAALPASAWKRFTVRDGEKGPLIVEAVTGRVSAKLGTSAGPEERLFIARELQGGGGYKHDYYLVHTGSVDASMAEMARVTKAEHRIEECIRRGKSDAGLGDYQVRNWTGWHHHMALSLVAAWFLIEATRRGKNIHAGTDGSATARPDREPAGGASRVQPSRERTTPRDPLVAANRIGTLLPLSRV